MEIRVETYGELLSSSRGLTNEACHTVPLTRERSVATPIDGNCTPLEAKDIRPDFASMLASHVHSKKRHAILKVLNLSP